MKRNRITTYLFLLSGIVYALLMFELTNEVKSMKQHYIDKNDELTKENQMLHDWFENLSIEKSFQDIENSRP